MDIIFVTPEKNLIPFVDFIKLITFRLQIKKKIQ